MKIISCILTLIKYLISVEPYSLILPLIKNFFISNIFYAIGTYTLELQSNLKTKLIFYFAKKSFDKVIFLSSFSKFNIEEKIIFFLIRLKQKL